MLFCGYSKKNKQKNTQPGTHMNCPREFLFNKIMKSKYYLNDSLNELFDFMNIF